MSESSNLGPRASWEDRTEDNKTPIHVRIYTESEYSPDVATYGSCSDLVKAEQLRIEAVCDAMDRTTKDHRKRWVLVELSLSTSVIAIYKGEDDAF